MRVLIKLKRLPKENEPSGGTLREVIKFAWWPEKIQQHLVWLEKYVSVQKYVLSECWDLRYEYKMKWIEMNRKFK